MAVLDLRELMARSASSETVVIHFQTEGTAINAYTLASALVSIADAAKAANASLNPGYEIEIVVEAVGPGSFRAQLRAIYKSAGNLFSKERARVVVLGLITSFIYEHTIGIDHQPKISISADEVVIETGKDKIIVPRDVHDAMKRAEENSAFTSAMSKSLETVGKDRDVQALGFVPRISAPPPEVVVSGETIRRMEPFINNEPDSRLIEELADLRILKALLVRSNRKWEFVWRGLKISAPIDDNAFYDRFFAHRITIAPGDILKATLVIRQVRDKDTGIYINTEYIVRNVTDHIPRMTDQTFDDDSHE